MNFARLRIAGVTCIVAVACWHPAGFAQGVLDVSTLTKYLDAVPNPLAEPHPVRVRPVLSSTKPEPNTWLVQGERFARAPT